MQLSIKHNFPDVQRAIDQIGKQAKFAAAVALTKTAQDVKAQLATEIDRVFDRPTPYTQRSLFMRGASVAKLEAMVWLKDESTGGGTPATKYLLPQIEGGRRGLKGFEARLVRQGIMAPTERAVPGAGAVIDRYGNMSRGQIVKILSQLGNRAFSGDYSVATNSKRSRAKRAQEAYFVSTGAGGTITIVNGEMRKGNGRTGHLARGIWVRRNFGAWGSAIKPVLLFVRSVSYRRLFKFADVAVKTANRNFPGHFDQQLARALATAR